MKGGGIIDYNTTFIPVCAVNHLLHIGQLFGILFCPSVVGKFSRMS
jgi:hypothetical protein